MRIEHNIKVIAVSLAVVGTAVTYGYDTYFRNLERQTEVRASQIKKSSGVNVHYRYDQNAFFPAHEFSNVKSSAASVRLVHSILPIIEIFLAKYSDELVQRNLSDIYLLEYLEFSGKSYGGTYKKSKIYVAVKNRQYSEALLLSILHAEFSSILFHNYNFPRKAWESVNEPGWKYLGTGFDMLDKVGQLDQTDELLENGFLIGYSQSDLENDFNQIIDWAFTKPSRLRELVSRYEKIRKKYELAIEFYDSIDRRIDIPRFGGKWQEQ